MKVSSSKILVLGAGGMAGHVVSLYLKESGLTVDTLSATNKLDKNTYLLDVMDTNKFNEFLSSKQYDAVVNCIGVLVKRSEERKDLAAYLNAYMPHFLEQYYKNGKTKVIHLSSDCVFSSTNPPYKEDSPYGGEAFYDRSKALGEIKNSKDLTFRMSIIGPDMQKSGTGLVNWFLQQKGEVSGYDRVIWSGITTMVLAKGIAAAIEQDISGIYHFVPKANISKYDLLLLFKGVFDREDIIVKPKNDVVLDRTLINTRVDFNFTVPDYKTMIQEMKDWMDSHKELYRHYYA